MTEDYRRALRLSYFTVGYNILEGIVSVVFAVAAGSSALLGFGIDSFVESLSGMVMIWRFFRTTDEERERLAIHLVGLSLLILGVYVIYESCTMLYFAKPPERNVVGLFIALVSMVVMPILYVRWTPKTGQPDKV